MGICPITYGIHCYHFIFIFKKCVAMFEFLITRHDANLLLESCNWDILLNYSTSLYSFKELDCEIVMTRIQVISDSVER